MFKKKRFIRKPRPVNRAAIFRPRPKCSLLASGVTEVDYKDTQLLVRHLNEEWKIQPGRNNNVSAKMQRQMKTAIKRARFLALLPYNNHHHLQPVRERTERQPERQQER